jgi:hypothetical protein
MPLESHASGEAGERNASCAPAEKRPDQHPAGTLGLLRYRSEASSLYYGTASIFIWAQADSHRQSIQIPV